MTIPRLELSAAVMAVKVDQLVKHVIDMSVDKTVFWTDSTIVLHYIANESQRYNTFVANRVALICENTEVAQWRHVESHFNPADDASRGLNADQLLSSDRWFNGPAFLLEDECFWPNSQIPGLDFSCDPEVKQKQVVYSAATTTVTATVMQRLFERYSNWSQLRITVVWLLRTKQFLLAKIRRMQVPDMYKAVALIELRQAEFEIVKYVQNDVFDDEIAILKGADANGHSMTTYSKKTSVGQLKKLELILINGVICIGGRLPTHQMILPRKHPVVALIIMHYHVMFCHTGREHVLSLVRQNYWIIKGRTTVRSVLSSCMTCRRLKAKPIVQKMANLPSDRVTPCEPPFTLTGVDVFGPFLVKRGRSEVKRYGCIFTCLVVRAVHIEILHSMETDSFLQALQRFICRRGQVTLLRSDNGSNFVGASNELRKAISDLNQKKVGDFLHNRNIEWIFNPPAASHMGGVWERQIRSVRNILSTLLKEQSLDDEKLNTLMCLVEAVINSRPITTVSDDHRDPEALTPNHLLLLRGTSSIPCHDICEKDNYSRKRWRQVMYLADVFWRRWVREYLPTLQLRQKWLDTTSNLKPGDIVILTDDKAPRNSWPLGRVIETLPSSDGLVHTVKIATKTSDGQTTLIRPVHKLCLLEAVQVEQSSD